MATAQIPTNTPIQQVPYQPLPNNSVRSLVEGRDQYTNGGVDVRYLELKGVRTKFQIHTIRVTKADERYPIDLLSNVTNDRIVGICLTSNETSTDPEQKYINNSQLQISIDNEEILPDGFDTSLISAKLDNDFYGNIYRINERADGSQIKGTFTCGPRIGESFKPFTLKIYFWSITKPRK